MTVHLRCILGAVCPDIPTKKKKNPYGGFTVTLQLCPLSSRIFPVPKIDSLTGHQFESVEEMP
jgi:hypothetical protein